MALHRCYAADGLVPGKELEQDWGGEKAFSGKNFKFSQNNDRSDSTSTKKEKMKKKYKKSNKNKGLVV
jgi:hypothetical protein